jgi:carbon-monoxide dehydrogenase medium subunit
VKPAPFAYERPSSLQAALQLLSANRGGARPLAGGQSLGPMLNLRIATPELLVDISRLPELRHAESTADGLTVGAGVCHADFEDGRVEDVAQGLLRRVAGGIAYRAVRNRGTIGGSLAHADPAADWPPVMLALGAEIEAVSERGRRSIPAAEFVTGILSTALQPEEVIAAVRIPRLAAGARWGHCKFSCKPGDFGESIAVIVIDPARRTARAVLAGHGQPPVLMRETAGVVAGLAIWSPGDAPAVKNAVLADLEAVGADKTLSRYELALHQASMSRAAREACAS